MSQSPGKIITFYSYKGGVGRSMALANIAWLLAECGHRVLMIDWDLEAPGLHRYFHPFLIDPELEASEGVIDYVWDYTSTALATDKTTRPDAEAFADLGRCAIALDYPFDRGVLDLIPAGRQSASYSQRVNTFEWHRFYGPLGGSRLLAADREKLRHEYDFVLVDSRTGVSDTSGICTIDLPDALVVCFTSNNQSIHGAHAVVESIRAQREERPLEVYPVLMRVELAEKEKLDATRQLVQERFSAPPSEGGESYWTDAEILYQPYYAYEELLAFFGDAPGSSKTLLYDMISFARRLSGKDLRPQALPDEKRKEIRDRFSRRKSRVTTETISFEHQPELVELHADAMRAFSLWKRLDRSPVAMLPVDRFENLRYASKVLDELRKDPAFAEFYRENTIYWVDRVPKRQRMLRWFSAFYIVLAVGSFLSFINNWQVPALPFVSWIELGVIGVFFSLLFLGVSRSRRLSQWSFLLSLRGFRDLLRLYAARGR